MATVSTPRDSGPARAEHEAGRGSARRDVGGSLVGFALLAAAAILLAPLVGSTTIHLGRVFDRSIPWAENLDAQIFFIARLPRVLAAALVGCALSCGK